VQGTYQGLEGALRGLVRHVLDGGAYREEPAAARDRFFSSGRPGPLGGEAAEARFLEWFAFERALATGRKPFEHYLQEGCPGLGLAEEFHALQFHASRAGIFRVLAMEDGRCELLDALQGDRLRLLWPEEAREHPSAGGCLLGRLYLQPGSSPACFLPSPAIVLYQESDLGRALLVDAGRARDAGRRLSLGQLDLESLLQGELPRELEPAAPALGLADLQERIQLLFERHGFAGVAPAELAEQAAGGASFDSVFGDLLDELAFDTDADLDELRRLFLALWNAARGQERPGPAGRPAAPRTGAWPDPEEPCPCGSGRSYLECHLGADLVGRLEEAEARHEKLGPVFEGLDFLFQEEGGEEAITPAEEGLIELDALVQEYLWEHALPRVGPEGRMLDAFLAHLRRRGPDAPALRAEDLVGPPLVGWLLRTCLTLPRQEGAAFLDLVRGSWPRLAAWLSKEHGFFAAGPEPLKFLERQFEGLARALRAGGALSGPEPLPGEGVLPAGVFQVVAGAGPERRSLSAWPPSGDPPRPLAPAGTGALRPGDLLWGRPLASGQGLVFQGEVRVGPVESAEFLDQAGLD